MMNKNILKGIVFLLLGILYTQISFAQHNYEFNNVGADIMIQPGATIYVMGDVRLNGGDFGNSGYVEVQGHFYNDNAASTQSGTGLVEFKNEDVNAGEVQQIRGDFDLTGNAAFYDVDLDNRAAAPMVELNGVNVGVKNTLEFRTANHRLRTATMNGTDGETYANYVHLETTDANALLNESVVAGAVTNFIEGRLRWDLAAATDYVIPVGFGEEVGGNGRANQVATISTNTGSGTIEASFTQDAGTAVLNSILTECDVEIDCVINHGWWNIDAISGSFTDFDLNVQAANYINCPGSVDVLIVKKTDGANALDYGLDGNDACDLIASTPASVDRSGFTGMSDFAIGSAISSCLDPCNPECLIYHSCNPNCPEYDECVCVPENCTSCEDGIQNGDETGVDCGGPDCPSCIECETNGKIFVDINATGDNDGSSWADAFKDLQSALAIGTNKTILLAEGLYLPTGTVFRTASFNMPNGVTILGGFSTGGGKRDIDSYTTILSGEIDGVSGLAGNSYHVVKAKNVSCVTIDGVTIKHGNANDANSYGRSRGGGIYAIGSELTLSNSKVSWNTAIKGGGTFASLCPNFTILRSEYNNNTADNGSGLFHSNQTNMYITKSRFINNNSLKRAVIEVNNSFYTKIENSIIAKNPSKNANAIALIATTRDQTIDVYNTTILGETKDKNLVILKVGFGNQLDANFYNSIIAHQDISLIKGFKAYNNGILNLYTENCYLQGNSVIGTAVNNLYSTTAGDLMLNLDYSVSECSPVVNAGNDAIAAGLVDINENNRFFGTVDIGAYEAQIPCAVTREFMDLSAKVSIFPNPARGELSIQTSEEDIMISIYDMLGKRMTYTSLREINISSYPSGVYILNIERNGEIIHMEKVIKE